MDANAGITLSLEGHIARVTLCRPERRNAMGMAFFDALADHFQRLDRDPDVRVVILQAAGENFTVGLDLMEAAALLGGGGADEREALREKIVELQAAVGAVETCRKPVIAAVQGYCLGGGVDLLCACDIRLAAADAVFGIRETRMAIIADLGTLQRLPHIIGHGWFRELALTGRDFSAAEALQMGFVTRVCPDRQALTAAADALAQQIAGLAPLTVQGVKTTINHGRDHGVPAGLAYVAQKNAAALKSEDLGEAITAFMEKRDPVFRGK